MPADDDTRWMAKLSTLDDHEVEALFAGTPLGDRDLAPVAEVARALRRLADREPIPQMSEALRAQIASPPIVPIGIHRATRTALMKAAVAAGVVALVGVGAAQNRLPAGVQNVVSSTVDLVGFDVPRSEERHVAGVGSGQGDNEGTDNANDGTPGYDGVTPGGADRADPGVPGDHEPATPATPPAAGREHVPAANANPNPNPNATGDPHQGG